LTIRNLGISTDRWVQTICDFTLQRICPHQSEDINKCDGYIRWFNHLNYEKHASKALSRSFLTEATITTETIKFPQKTVGQVYYKLCQLLKQLLPQTDLL
jgi:hypothetical protein